MFKIQTGKDLHYKVVESITRFYKSAIITDGLVENQDTAFKGIDSYRKGYQKGQLDILICKNHIKYSGLAIEFKSSTNNYKISDAQKEIYIYIKNTKWV